MLPVVNAIWIGPTLGPIHAACLRSFVRHGHRTVLHVYERPTDLPEGLNLADARRLLPKSRVIRHRQNGSPAIFGDLLRYELLAQGLGLYVDCDVFCLRPIEDEDYIYGWARPAFINNAVLKLPPDCPALATLRRMKDSRWRPLPWLSWKRRAYGYARSAIGAPVALEDLPWGSTGPVALTWCLKKHRLEIHAQPIEAFNLLEYREAEMVNPERRLDDLIRPQTTLLHLFHNNLVKLGVRDIPPASPLGRLLSS